MYYLFRSQWSLVYHKIVGFRPDVIIESFNRINYKSGVINKLEWQVYPYTWAAQLCPFILLAKETQKINITHLPEPLLHTILYQNRKIIFRCRSWSSQTSFPSCSFSKKQYKRGRFVAKAFPLSSDFSIMELSVQIKPHRLWDRDKSQYRVLCTKIFLHVLFSSFQELVSCPSGNTICTLRSAEHLIALVLHMNKPEASTRNQFRQMVHIFDNFFSESSGQLCVVFNSIIKRIQTNKSIIPPWNFPGLFTCTFLQTFCHFLFSTIIVQKLSTLPAQK